MSNFDDIREWLEKMNKDGEPKYKRFNIWLPIDIDKLPIEPSDVVITHRAVPDETQVKVWIPTEYFEKYRRGYQAFKKNKEKEQNND